MLIQDNLDTRVPICKVCGGKLDRRMKIEGRDGYNGHVFFCVDCNTEYRIKGMGQSDNELYVEYDRHIIKEDKNDNKRMGDITSFCRRVSSGVFTG